MYLHFYTSLTTETTFRHVHSASEDGVDEDDDDDDDEVDMFEEEDLFDTKVMMWSIYAFVLENAFNISHALNVASLPVARANWSSWGPKVSVEEDEDTGTASQDECNGALLQSSG